MSTTTRNPAPVPAPDAPIEPTTVTLRSVWKTPIAFAVFTLAVASLVVFAPREGETHYRLGSPTDMFTIPEFGFPSTPTVWAAVAVMAVLTVVSVVRVRAGHRVPLWMVGVFSVVGMIGFLAWAAAGGSLPMVSLLAGSITLAMPLSFGAMGGVLGERSGVVNIAIEAQLLLGAFGAAMFGTLGGSPWFGLVAAMLCGALVALVLAFFAITHFVEQVIVGVVLNVLVMGVTGFLFGQLMAEHPDTLNSPVHFQRLPIPVLGDLPIIGPTFFRQTALGYLMYVVVVLVAWGLYRTRWGLRVRAVGEHPKAADTVGINVIRTRYTTVLLAGLVAGMGGATYTLISTNSFGRDMTDGAGYIALAAVIFGRWDPIRATLAALLFGFATNLSGVLSAVDSPVPAQFMLMLPYVVTVVAVAGLVGHSRAPAADGVPYRK